MKNKIAFTFLISAFLFTLSTPTNAFGLDFTYGYYNTTVYVQNKATGDYYNAADAAINSWTGISPRSVVKNSVSSSNIYDEDFNIPPLEVYANDYGVYINFGNSGDSCHTATSFNVFINNADSEVSGSYNFKISVIAHELGHALGIGHWIGNEE